MLYCYDFVCLFCIWLLCIVFNKCYDWAWCCVVWWFFVFVWLLEDVGEIVDVVFDLEVLFVLWCGVVWIEGVLVVLLVLFKELLIFCVIEGLS